MRCVVFWIVGVCRIINNALIYPSGYFSQAHQHPQSKARHISEQPFNIKIILEHIVALFVPPPRQEYIEQAPIVVELTIEEYAKQEVIKTWSEAEWESFNKIIIKESGWKPTAQNPTSTAYGTAQFLDSTWKSVGCYKTDIAELQIDCAIKYIEKRYETPSKAWKHHLQNDWY